MIDKKWLLYLAIPALWTIFFSLFDKPGIRGWRNIGWLACYVVGLAMLWNVGWRRACSTWLMIGLATGLLYYIYQAWSLRGEPDPVAKAQLTTIVYGAAAWPIMLPEVIEYSLVDAGILKVNKPAVPEKTTEESDDGA